MGESCLGVDHAGLGMYSFVLEWCIVIELWNVLFWTWFHHWIIDCKILENVPDKMISGSLPAWIMLLIGLSTSFFSRSDIFVEAAILYFVTLLSFLLVWGSSGAQVRGKATKFGVEHTSWTPASEMQRLACSMKSWPTDSSIAVVKLLRTEYKTALAINWLRCICTSQLRGGTPLAMPALQILK